MASYTRIAFVEIVDSHNEEPLDDKPPEDLDADEILVGKYLLLNQVGKPTDRPTMRWVFQLFEGVGLLIICSSANVGRRVLGLELVHEWTLRLLGPTFKNPRSAQLNLRNVDATAACNVIDPLITSLLSRMRRPRATPAFYVPSSKACFAEVDQLP